MPLIEQRLFIIEDEYLPEIRLVASEIERLKMLASALNDRLVHLVGMATGVDLEIDNCELDAMRGVVRCEPAPINVMEEMANG